MEKRGQKGAGKKAQLTLIVVLGVVILFVFIFLFIASANIRTKQLQTQADVQVQEYLNQNSINQYVTSCVGIVAKEAVIRAGLSGFTFDNTRQHVAYTEPIYNRVVNVSIIVEENSQCGLVRNNPPDYPYPNISVFSLRGLYTSDPHTCAYSGLYLPYSGFFGYNNLLKLCNWNGTNRLGATSTFGFSTCETGTYNWVGDVSLQEELENFISQELPKCANLTQFSEKSLGNITIEDNPTTKITFGVGGFNVKVEYPFIVKIKNRQPVTKMVDFTTDEPIPLKELYDYSFYTIINDVNDPEYDIVADRARSDILRFYRNYEVSKLRNVDGNYVDIVRIVDNGTNIEGKPMVALFAIKNRRPALDFYHNNIGTDRFDVIALENESIVLHPQGYDPDEDNLTYNYTMWREDYTEKYNFSDIKCRDPSHSSIDYIIANCTIARNFSYPHNWTGSQLFLITKKDAVYNSSTEDTGYHEVKISIVDRAGLNDWQVVRIMIFDLPVARINGTNLYPDVDDKYASVEDPYLFNGTASTVGLTGLLGNNFSMFIWNDSILTNGIPSTLPGEFYVIKKIETDLNKTLLIPNDTNRTFNITNIQIYVYANNSYSPMNSYPPVQSRIHNVTLTVNTSYGITDAATFSVNVTQCLNHTNATDFPYPYNNLPYNLQDALYADHTCCANNMMYKTTSTVCYDTIHYSGELGFTDFRTLQPSPPKNSYGPTYVNSVANQDNDIFSQEFIRTCSGNSGNTCTGDGSEIRTNIESCRDDNYGTTTANGRCSGPPFNTGTNNFQISNVSNTIHCINYSTGNTFEKYRNISNGFATTPADNYCDNTQRYSTGPGPNGYDTSNTGKYYCIGQCNGINDGRCKFADRCICWSGGGAVSGSLQCNGIQYPGNGNPPTPTCTAAGQTFIKDTCSSCGIIDDPASNTICRSAPIGGVGGYAPGCTASTQCNNRILSSAFINDPGQFCDNACIHGSCTPFAVQNPAARTCKTSCAANTDCALGYQCCTDPTSCGVNYQKCIIIP